MKKYFLIIMAVFILGSELSMAQYPNQQYFTENDLAKDGDKIFQIKPADAVVLNHYGESCAKAMMASILWKAHIMAERYGTLYPDKIEVSSVEVSSISWARGLRLETDIASIDVYVNPDKTPCVAGEAIVD